MRKYLVFSLVVIGGFGFLLSGCKQDKHLRQAGTAAVSYYTMLIKGQYDKYVDGMLSCDNAPKEFREQMKLLAKQFIAREKEENGGIRTVELIREDLTTDGLSAEVYLKLKYTSGRSEEVVIPMCYSENIWRMQ